MHFQRRRRSRDLSSIQMVWTCTMRLKFLKNCAKFILRTVGEILKLFPTGLLLMFWLPHQNPLSQQKLTPKTQVLHQHIPNSSQNFKSNSKIPSKKMNSPRIDTKNAITLCDIFYLTNYIMDVKDYGIMTMETQKFYDRFLLKNENKNLLFLLAWQLRWVLIYPQGNFSFHLEGFRAWMKREQQQIISD